MFSKVLVAVDGSNNSFRALDAALLLSEKLDAKVTVIYVIEVAPVVHIQSEKLLRDLVGAYEKEGQHIISKCSEIATKRGLSINSKLLSGDPSSIILDICEKDKHDIVIMGSRGMGKFKELVLGSVSSKVIHHSSCAVMIIR